MSGPDTNCCTLGQLGSSLAKLQVISVSHASKKEITQVLTGTSAQLIHHVEVDYLEGLSFVAESSEVVGAHWWDQLCGLSFINMPSTLTTLVINDGQGHSYIWTSELAACHASPLSSAHGAASAAEIHGAGEAKEANGWHRAWRKQKDRVARRLAALQVLFFAELAASIHASNLPLTLSGAGGSNTEGGHTNRKEEYMITCDDLCLVLTGL